MTTPLEFIIDTFADYDITHYNLSTYTYIPNQVKDGPRTTYQVQPNLLQQFVKNLQLNPQQEIAMHSEVDLQGEKYHIPMIDFDVPDKTRIEEIKPTLKKFNITKATLFKSGRGFHLYGNTLLQDEPQLREFLGHLLAYHTRGANKKIPPESKDLIDSRWVGHRIIGGYLSMRITNNSGTYQQVPEHAFEIYVE